MVFDFVAYLQQMNQHQSPTKATTIIIIKTTKTQTRIGPTILAIKATTFQISSIEFW